MSAPAMSFTQFLVVSKGGFFQTQQRILYISNKRRFREKLVKEFASNALTFCILIIILIQGLNEFFQSNSHLISPLEDDEQITFNIIKYFGYI